MSDGENLTYEQLEQMILFMTPDQKKSTVTVKLEDDYYPIKNYELTDEEDCDVLDDKHPILVAKQFA